MLWWNMLFKYTVLNYRLAHTVAKLSDPKFNLCEVSKPDLGKNVINRTIQQLLHDSVLLNQAMLSWNSSACRAAIALPHRSLFHQPTSDVRVSCVNLNDNELTPKHPSFVLSFFCRFGRTDRWPPVSMATLLSNRSFAPRHLR